MKGQKPLFPDSVEPTYVAIDVETTGLNPYLDRVVQIGLVTADADFKVSWEGAVLVDPEIPIPAVTTSIHGISDGDVQGCFKFRDLISWLGDIIGGKQIVGHNLPFDLSFLAEEHRREGLAVPPLGGEFDTLAIARVQLLGLGSYSLSKVAMGLGIDLERAHDACFDALLSLEVLRRLKFTIDKES